MKDYIYVGTATNKNFCIDGINVFGSSWRSMGEFDIVLEPNTKKPFSFSRYTIQDGKRTLQFLAGQFREGEWSFFVDAVDGETMTL